MSVNQVAMILLEDEYYETVAYGFIVEAVYEAVKEHGQFESVEELNEYIKCNLI